MALSKTKNSMLVRDDVIRKLISLGIMVNVSTAELEDGSDGCRLPCGRTATEHRTENPAIAQVLNELHGRTVLPLGLLK